jgi:antitoxin component of MazEF toxin-antitoxin module
MVTGKICKWGSSAAIRLPVKVMKAAGLEIGSHVTIEIVEGDILLKPVSTIVSNDTTAPENFTPTR